MTLKKKKKKLIRQCYNWNCKIQSCHTNNYWCGSTKSYKIKVCILKKVFKKFSYLQINISNIFADIFFIIFFFFLLNIKNLPMLLMIMNDVINKYIDTLLGAGILFLKYKQKLSFNWENNLDF